MMESVVLKKLLELESPLGTRNGIEVLTTERKRERTSSSLYFKTQNSIATIRNQIVKKHTTAKESYQTEVAYSHGWILCPAILVAWLWSPLDAKIRALESQAGLFPSLGSMARVETFVSSSRPVQSMVHPGFNTRTYDNNTQKLPVSLHSLHSLQS